MLDFIIGSIDFTIGLIGFAVNILLAYLCLKWLNKYWKTAEKEQFERFLKYKEEREHRKNVENEFNDVEANLKQHLETDGFSTEPRPFTQDDMRKWQMRQR